MMFLGMILYRKGILSSEKSTEYYRKLIWVGFIPGLIISGIGLNQAYASEWNAAYLMNIGANYKFVSGLFMALGYIGLVIWCYKKGILKKFQKEHSQIVTQEGYIEHDLEEIYQNLLELVKKASEILPNPKFISITNQRETFTLFNEKDGKPVHNAIVWQCTRGQSICEKILNDDLKRAKKGLSQ